MSDAKHEILQRLRNVKTTMPSKPAEPPTRLQYENLAAQFREALAGVGGRCEEVGSTADLGVALQRHPEFDGANQIATSMPEILNDVTDKTCVSLDADEQPHSMQDIDLAVFPGEFGVAENGAVWIAEDRPLARAAHFLTQHLCLVVSSQAIVTTMHDAYERLSFSGRGFGTFISGPSKTADIEQSLVIGAHGPRSCTVYLVGETG